MGSESVTTIKMQRVPKTLRPGQMFFRPALVWQTMLDDHVADAGLEFSLDVSTGRNQARFISDVRIDAGSARWHEVMHKQLALVASADGREDQDAVKKQLIAAGTWGEAERLAQLIRTCYVTPAVANQVLVEVAGAGAVEIIQVLLQAGACPDYAEPALDDKTALHVACEAGHEDIAALLIASMSSEGVARETRSGGHTAIQMLRRSDMGGFARRLEAINANAKRHEDAPPARRAGDPPATAESSSPSAFRMPGMNGFVDDVAVSDAAECHSEL